MTAVELLFKQLETNVMWTDRAKKLVEQAKEMETKEKLKHQLFIGKVSDVIGVEKTIKLLKETLKETLNEIK